MYMFCLILCVGSKVWPSILDLSPPNKEHAKIDIDVTYRKNLPWVGKALRSYQRGQSKCTCSYFGWHRLKITHRGIYIKMWQNRVQRSMQNIFVSQVKKNDLLTLVFKCANIARNITNWPNPILYFYMCPKT